MLSTGTQSVNTRANFSKLLQVDRLFPKFASEHDM